MKPWTAILPAGNFTTAVQSHIHTHTRTHAHTVVHAVDPNEVNQRVDVFFTPDGYSIPKSLR